MKKFTLTIIVILGVLTLYSLVRSATVLFPYQGGTGIGTVPLAGQVLIGTSGGIYNPAYLTAGTNITISTSSGGITINGASTSDFVSGSSTATRVAYWSATTTVTGSELFYFDEGNGLTLADVSLDIRNGQVNFFDTGATSTLWLAIGGALDQFTIQGPDGDQAILNVSSLTTGRDFYFPDISGSFVLGTSTIGSLAKWTATNTIQSATAGTDYEVPLTFGDGLTRTVNDVDCDIASGSVFGCLQGSDFSVFLAKASSTEAYLTIANTSGLSAERALAAGSNIVFTDGGANSTLTVGVTTTPTFATTTITGGGIVMSDGVQVGSAATYASGANNVALGVSAQALGNRSVAIGFFAKSSSTGAGLAIGRSALVTEIGGVAINGNAGATANNSCVAIGDGTICSGANSFALSANALASGTSSIAIGDAAVSSHQNSVAIGPSTQSTAANQFKIGTSTLPLDLDVNGTLTLISTSTTGVLKVGTSTANQGITAIFTATSSINLASIATSASGETTMTVNGVSTSTSNVCILGGFYDAINSGTGMTNGTFMCYVSGTNTATIRYTNNSTLAAADAATSTYRIEIHSF